MYKLDMELVNQYSGAARKAEIKRQVDAMRTPRKQYRATAVFNAAKAMHDNKTPVKVQADTMRSLQAPHRTRRPLGDGLSNTRVGARDKTHVHNRTLRDSGKVF